jgi:glycine cleavage system H lipoate-binding protein
MKINSNHFNADLLYSKKEIWLKSNGNRVILGFDDVFFQRLRKISEIKLTFLDNELEKDDVMATIYYHGEIKDIFLPYAGKAIKVNKLLEEDPELLIEDPYRKRWLIKVSNVSEEDIDCILTSNKAKEWFH